MYRGRKLTRRRNLILESNSWRIDLNLNSFSLSLDSSIRFRRPASGAITRRRPVAYIKTVQSTLQAGIIHVQVATFIWLNGLPYTRLVRSSISGFGVDCHRRGAALLWGWRRVSTGDGVKRLNAGKSQGGLRIRGIGNRRRRIRAHVLIYTLKLIRLSLWRLVTIISAVWVPCASSPCFITVA